MNRFRSKRSVFLLVVLLVGSGREEAILVGEVVRPVEAAVGDAVLWDNRCTMHRRDAFDPSARRVMHRTQIRGLLG
jgi:hypothetical protein